MDLWWETSSSCREPVDGVGRVVLGSVGFSLIASSESFRLMVLVSFQQNRAT